MINYFIMKIFKILIVNISLLKNYINLLINLNLNFIIYIDTAKS